MRSNVYHVSLKTTELVVDRPNEELREGEDDLNWPGGGAEMGRNEAKKD